MTGLLNRKDAAAQNLSHRISSHELFAKPDALPDRRVDDPRIHDARDARRLDLLNGENLALDAFGILIRFDELEHHRTVRRVRRREHPFLSAFTERREPCHLRERLRQPFGRNHHLTPNEDAALQAQSLSSHDANDRGCR